MVRVPIDPKRPDPGQEEPADWSGVVFAVALGMAVFVLLVLVR